MKISDEPEKGTLSGRYRCRNKVPFFALLL